MAEAVLKNVRVRAMRHTMASVASPKRIASNMAAGFDGT